MLNKILENKYVDWVLRLLVGNIHEIVFILEPRKITSIIIFLIGVCTGIEFLTYMGLWMFGTILLAHYYDFKD